MVADETDTDAAIFIAFSGQPGAAPLSYQVQLIGGTPTDATELHGVHTLASEGRHVILVARNHRQGEMRASVNGGGYAAEAVSLVLPAPPPPPPPPPQPTAHNIAIGAAVQMTPTGTGSVANGGYWNAEAHPPASVTFTWPNPVTITQLSLVVVQTPNAATLHQIFGIHTDGTQVLIASLSGVTSDGQTLLQSVQPPMANLQSVRIDSITSPSWVAWRNIQIFGY